MPKVNAMLVVLNEKAFNQTLSWLNFDNVNLVAAVTENGSGKVVNLNGKQLPLVSFTFIHQIAVANKNLLWLICGFRNSLEELKQTKDFLILSGIPERQIINFELSAQINPIWVANLHHIEQNGADVFATGSNAVMHGLDLKNIYSDNTHGGVYQPS